MQYVMVDRQQDHGRPEDSFELIAQFWSSYLGIEVKDYQVAVMMGLLKIARMKFNPSNEDNHCDLAGYAACGAELATSAKKDRMFGLTGAQIQLPNNHRNAGFPIMEEEDLATHLANGGSPEC